MRVRYRLIQAILMLSSFLLLWHCDDSGESESKNGGQQEKAIPIEVAGVARGEISAYFSGTATLEAEEEATVVARAEGVVKRILVEEGQQVKEGQVLAVLDKERLAKQAAQARANLQRLENDFQRSQALFERNLISAEAFQQAKSDFEAQQAAFDLTELELSYANIRAPISGVISARMIKVGNMLSQYQEVFRITDFDPLHAILHIPEREIAKLAVSQKATFLVDAHSGIIFEGRILRISPVVDPASGTVKVTVETSDRSAKLKPGMFARVNIVYDTHRNTLLIPKQAVLTEDAETAVYVVRDSLAHRQLVRTGYVNGQQVEIVEGLQMGDTVVVTGQGGLEDSSRVDVVAVKPAIASTGS